MAVLNKIRQRSLVLILVIALALFAFVIGDVFRNLDSGGGPQDIIATINGEDIKREPFMLQVQNAQQRFGSSRSETQIKNSIYDQELRRIIMTTEIEKLGLSVEEDKMLELLENNFSSYPEFQNQDSIFDINRLKSFISNLKEISPQGAPLGNFTINYEQWTNNEQALADNALTQQYYNLLKAGVNATVAEAEADYIAENKTVNVRYVQVPYTSIPDSLVEVTKKEIKAYMEQNKDEYQVEATREIVYVEFREDASKEDEDAIKAELLGLKTDKLEFNEVSKGTDTIRGFDNADNVEAFVNSNSDIKFTDTFNALEQLGVAKDSISKKEIGEYYGPYKDGEYFKLAKLIEKKSLPDSVKTRHILIPYIGAASARPDVELDYQQAQNFADSLYSVLKTDISKFDEFVTSYSSDLGSKSNGGRYDWFAYSRMVQQFRDFSFQNKTGDMDVVESPFGFHIIEIEGQKGSQEVYKVATLARKIEPSEQTVDEVFNNKQKFEIAAETGEFTDLAEERNLTLKPVTFKELDENIPGLGNQRQVVRWAFDEDTKEGDYKSFPIAGVGFIVAKLVDVNKEGLMDVESATTSVLPIVRNKKKAALIKEKITASTLDEIAKNQGQTVRSASGLTLKNKTLSGAGIEPAVIGTAFGLPQGTPSKPIAGEKGVYIVEVTKINEATELDNYTANFNRLSTTRKNAAQSQVFNALKEAAEIEDNRSKTVY